MVTVSFISSKREDKDGTAYYDIDIMNKAISGGDIVVPKGLSGEERRRFLREKRANVSRG